MYFNTIYKGRIAKETGKRKIAFMEMIDLLIVEFSPSILSVLKFNHKTVYSF